MHVTKPTAHKLADAGYPQDGKSGAFYFPDNLGGGFISPCSEIAGTQSQFPGAVYAPNVLELMQAINERCLLSHINDNKWEVLLRVDNGWSLCFYHDNPAEALAEAYLHIHQPTR